MKRFDIIINEFAYSLPTLPSVEWKGGLVVTDPNHSTYVIAPPGYEIIIYKDDRFFNMKGDSLTWEDYEHIFANYVVGRLE